MGHGVPSPLQVLDRCPGCSPPPPSGSLGEGNRALGMTGTEASHPGLAGSGKAQSLRKSFAVPEGIIPNRSVLTRLTLCPSPRRPGNILLITSLDQI